MAKRPQKTNALGMELSPGSFKTNVEKERNASTEVPPNILPNLDTDKPVIKGFSLTLQEENVKKLREIAKSRGISVSKIVDYLIEEFLKDSGML